MSVLESVPTKLLPALYIPFNPHVFSSRYNLNENGIFPQKKPPQEETSFNEITESYSTSFSNKRWETVFDSFTDLQSFLFEIGLDCFLHFLNCLQTEKLFYFLLCAGESVAMLM